MASAWVKQIASQVEKHGKRKASFYCFWKEPGGRLRKKTFGSGPDGKRLAEMHAAELNAQLKLGTYHDAKLLGWDEFFKSYSDGPLSRLAPRSKADIANSLKHVERILRLKGKALDSITSEAVERFIDARLKESGKKPDSAVSPSSVNKDLRNLRTALNKAKKLGHISEVPSITFLREPERLPPFITDDHFDAIWKACHVASKPADHPLTKEWWQGLLAMDIMTGWRISELLALEWKDVDLEAGYATTRASTNKGKRDSVVWLHPVVRDCLRQLRLTADPQERVFAWNHHIRTLYDQFRAIQKAAGIELKCRNDRPHTCTEACKCYGFHDGRRAFATHNAANMSREALRVLMRHASEQTTARYINYAQQIQPAVQNLHVPVTLRLPAPAPETGIAKAE